MARAHGSKRLVAVRHDAGHRGLRTPAALPPRAAAGRAASPAECSRDGAALARARRSHSAPTARRGGRRWAGGTLVASVAPARVGSAVILDTHERAPSARRWHAGGGEDASAGGSGGGRWRRRAPAAAASMTLRLTFRRHRCRRRARGAERPYSASDAMDRKRWRRQWARRELPSEAEGGGRLRVRDLPLFHRGGRRARGAGVARAPRGRTRALAVGGVSRCASPRSARRTSIATASRRSRRVGPTRRRG